MGTDSYSFPFQEPTVLILGAGASKPYGFPLGFELVDDITGAGKTGHKIGGLYPSPMVAESDADRADRELLDRFRNDLKYSGVSSVDRFLELWQHKRYMYIGISAICTVLSGYEKLGDHQLPLSKRKQDVYREIVEQLLPFGEGPVELEKRRLTILTFNYERSLEQYLSRSFAVRWKCAVGEAWAVLSEYVKIVHLYGSLNENDRWMSMRDNSLKRESDINNSVRIIGQARDDDMVFAEAIHILEEAKVVAFIGFGFDPVNMRRLGLAEPGSWLKSTPVILPLFHGCKTDAEWSKRMAGAFGSVIGDVPKWTLEKNHRPKSAVETVAMGAHYSQRGYVGAV